MPEGTAANRLLSEGGEVARTGVCSRRGVDRHARSHIAVDQGVRADDSRLRAAAKGARSLACRQETPGRCAAGFLWRWSVLTTVG